jgi:hypothetical protein
MTVSSTDSAREVAWLIERKWPVNSIGTTEPRWYAENEDDGWHWWTTTAHEAKWFDSKEEAEAFEPYRMIASNPTISITEHVWINDGFSRTHGVAPTPRPSSDTIGGELIDRVERIRLYAQDTMDTQHAPRGAIGNLMAIRDEADALLSALQAPQYTGVAEGKQLRAVFSILHNLDLKELEDAGIIIRGANGGSDWRRFNNDVGTFILKLPEDRLEKLAVLVSSKA